MLSVKNEQRAIETYVELLLDVKSGVDPIMLFSGQLKQIQVLSALF